MGYRQKVRHRILAPVFAGSSPASPVRFLFFIETSFHNLRRKAVIKGTSNAPGGFAEF